MLSITLLSAPRASTFTHPQTRTRAGSTADHLPLRTQKPIPPHPQDPLPEECGIRIEQAEMVGGRVFFVA